MERRSSLASSSATGAPSAERTPILASEARVKEPSVTRSEAGTGTRAGPSESGEEGAHEVARAEAVMSAARRRCGNGRSQ
ncbi:hypothetical protein [Nonomuraea dietziae]|uniref:hypothetical protein n=1 Tax=Nonomuraea dietziae TaxID=65515 RepID=UPI0031D4DD07